MPKVWIGSLSIQVQKRTSQYKIKAQEEQQKAYEDTHKKKYLKPERQTTTKRRELPTKKNQNNLKLQVTSRRMPSEHQCSDEMESSRKVDGLQARLRYTTLDKNLDRKKPSHTSADSVENPLSGPQLRQKLFID